MKEFSEDEKIIARNIDKEHKWMVRDSDKCLYVYMKKPTKLDDGWYASTGFGEFFTFNHMFSAVKWEDDEPTLIKNIYDPQILDAVERKYLKAVLKPFHDGVVYVEKLQSYTIDGRAYNKEYLHIKLHDEGFTLPSFDIGKMYTGMELSNKYTLKELGITYKEGENE